MLFNSYEFIFVFLPVTLAGFYVLGALSRTWSLHWLILASFFFYAWWRPLNVLLIAPSILINFVLARILQRLVRNEKRRHVSLAVLLLGLAFNVAFLGYFKYTYFLGTAINDVFGAHLILTHIILPLGISFITFQKIAFLIDVHSRRIESFTLQDYCLFVLFFPQLIAGPIVHYREMMPQFHSVPCRFDKENVAVGLTLVLFGLFKKAVIADGIAPPVTSIYDHAAAGGGVSLLFAWIAAIGFTLQLYFDFSGYTDMALGAARFFGIRLPPNFNSPLRASSIIDFWLRWHMTLAAVFASMVLFRSPTMSAAIDLVKGMIGLNGVSLPLALYERIGPLAGWLEGMGVVQQPWGGQDFLRMAIAIQILMFVVLACPNTLQILARYEPAIGVKPRPADTVVGRRMVEWSPSVAWAIGISVIAAMGILSLGGPSEFLYWQF